MTSLSRKENFRYVCYGNENDIKYDCAKCGPDFCATVQWWWNIMESWRRELPSYLAKSSAPSSLSSASAWRVYLPIRGKCGSVFRILAMAAQVLRHTPEVQQHQWAYHQGNHFNAPVRQLWADFFWRVASRDKKCEEQEEKLRGKHVTQSLLFVFPTWSSFIFVINQQVISLGAVWVAYKSRTQS